MTVRDAGRVLVIGIAADGEVLVIAPSSQELGPPTNPGRFRNKSPL